MEHALVGSGIAAVVMVATAAIAGHRAPGEGTRGAMQHLAAGVICAVVAAELVPEAIETGRAVEVSAGFVAGFVSVTSFLGLARSIGGYNAALRRIFLGDVVALVCLVLAAMLYGFQTL